MVENLWEVAKVEMKSHKEMKTQKMKNSAKKDIIATQKK